MSLTTDIANLIQGHVADDRATLEAYSRDASLFAVKPRLVAYPKNRQDIQAVIRYVNNHPGLSITVRSAGTDMTGGPLNESIILDVSRHFNHIVSWHGQSITTQPGVLYRELEKVTLKHNLLLPSYPASREICTVGGMVANNSGGEKSLTYGKTDRYVRRLKVVLDDGQEYTFSPLDTRALQQKMALKTREGNIYRRMFKVVDDNYDLLQQARPPVSKNSAGYYLWDVWDKHTFDLTKLFTGAQGTLGIITEISFALIPPKPYARLLVIFMPDIAALAQVVQTTLSYQPESFESYDDNTLRLAVRFFPHLLKQMKGNLLTLLWQLLPELRMIVSGGIPKLILLAEFTGFDQTEVDRRARDAQAALRQFDLKTHLAGSPQEAHKFWVIRRESFNLLRRHVPSKHTAPFIDDIIVQPKQLPQFLPQLNEIMSQYDITYTIAGHIGDANFHIIPLMDTQRPDFAGIVSELEEKVYDLVLSYRGSITGEHNDGLIRSFYLPTMYGQKVYELFKQVKDIFDPRNIFNPGKKVNASKEYAMRHLDRA